MALGLEYAHAFPLNHAFCVYIGERRFLHRKYISKSSNVVKSNELFYIFDHRHLIGTNFRSSVRRPVLRSYLLHFLGEVVDSKMAAITAPAKSPEAFLIHVVYIAG
jgi:hypothetical protein